MWQRWSIEEMRAKKGAADGGWTHDVVRSADLEIGDWFARSRSLSPSGLASVSRLPEPLKSAGLETCATPSGP